MNTLSRYSLIFLLLLLSVCASVHATAGQQKEQITRPAPICPAAVSGYKPAKMSLFYHFYDWALHVKYMNADELASFEVSYDKDHNQWIYIQSKSPLEKGTYMMAMSMSGSIYLLGEVGGVALLHTVRSVHHSSFFRGKALASAGRVAMSANSQIWYIDTITGHYWRGFEDEEQNWGQFVTEIRLRGENTLGIKVISGYADPFTGNGKTQLIVLSD